MGSAGEDEDVRRTGGRVVVGAGVVVFGVTVVEGGFVAEVGDDDEDVVVVELELLVVDVLEVVLAGAVIKEGAPPGALVPHPATAINSTGTARNRRRMPWTLPDSFLYVLNQHFLANQIPQLIVRNRGT